MTDKVEVRAGGEETYSDDDLTRAGFVPTGRPFPGRPNAKEYTSGDEDNIFCVERQEDGRLKIISYFRVCRRGRR